MRRRWWALLLAAACVPVAASFTPPGQMAWHGLRAWLASTSHFTQCTPDPRVWCEPGAGELGAAVASMLPAAQQRVEQAFGMPYAAPIHVNVYASDDSFSRYSGLGSKAAGAVMFGQVHIAARLQHFPAARTAAILTHEMAHLHLQQRIGVLGGARLPNWFWEGLPTYISGGGGAGDTTRAQTVFAFTHGRHLVPEDAGSLLHPRYAGDYGLSPAMYYSQAALLIGWMDKQDPAAFRRMLGAIGHGEDLAPALTGAYGRPLAVLWGDFGQAMQRDQDAAWPAR